MIVYRCARKDCFAYNPNRDNYCNALQDINFGCRECPFYKNYKQRAAELGKEAQTDEETEKESY